MKKTLIIITACMLALTGCSSNRQSSSTEKAVPNKLLVGAYGEQREISEEEMAMFRNVMANDESTVYTPLSVSTQVVAGINYRFWVRYERPSIEGPEYSWITIYKPLPGQGEPKVTSIVKEESAR